MNLYVFNETSRIHIVPQNSNIQNLKVINSLRYFYLNFLSNNTKFEY